MLSDAGKIILLAVLMTICIVTFFSSTTISMGSSPMGKLRKQEHCEEPRKVARICLEQGNVDCSDVTRAASKCESVVRRAYQHINFGGCPYELQAQHLCEAEWCQADSGGDPASCQRECFNVRQSLKTCVDRQVSLFFVRNGLQNDGTLSAHGHGTS